MPVCVTPSCYAGFCLCTDNLNAVYITHLPSLYPWDVIQITFSTVVVGSCNRCLGTWMAAQVLGVKEVYKNWELVTLTGNMLTGLSCVEVVIILQSAAAVRNSSSCERHFICLPQSSLRAWLTMKGGKNQGAQGCKRRRETDKRGCNT